MVFTTEDYNLKFDNCQVYASVTDGSNSYEALIDQDDFYKYAEDNLYLNYNKGEDEYTYSEHQFLDDDTDINIPLLIIEYIEVKKITPKLIA